MDRKDMKTDKKDIDSKDRSGSSLQAGYGEKTITPPLGTDLAGFGFYLDRRATMSATNSRFGHFTLRVATAPFS